ncbi:MAG: methyltransferase [Bacteroidia bacterium]|nr:methyltransferase [Bacteroidia bacterium]
MDRQKKIEQYIARHLDEEDGILRELDRETHLKVLGARMISGHLQGQVLTMFSKMIRPLRILELGTFTGYSAICLALGLKPDGKLITIEIDDELQQIANDFFIKAGLQDKIIQKIGPALEIIPTLSESFDLVFIDADKREYSAYYHAVFPKVKNGGFILADNTLWNGKVLDELEPGDKQTQGIIDFNASIKSDTRIEKIILPLRDGLTIIRKK